MNERKTPTGRSQTNHSLDDILKGEIMVLPPPATVNREAVEDMLTMARRRFGGENGTWTIPGDKIVQITEDGRLALRKGFAEFALNKGRLIVFIATNQDVIRVFEEIALKTRLEFRAFGHYKQANEFVREFRKPAPKP